MSWLVKDDSTAVAPGAVAPVAPPSAPAKIGPYDPASGTFGTPAPAATVIMAVQPEDAFSEAKIVDKLRGALASAHTAGIDFHTFWQSLGAVQTVIADEPTRYRAALGTLTAQGGSLQSILSTVGQYLQTLDSKESSFEEFLKERHRAEVDAKVAEADLTKEQIQAKSEQIAKLTQDIQDLQTKELTARNAATTAEAQLNANHTTFTTVKGRLANEIAMVRDRLTTYCGTTLESK
jgi:hypothetical protein